MLTLIDYPLHVIKHLWWLIIHIVQNPLIMLMLIDYPLHVMIITDYPQIIDYPLIINIVQKSRILITLIIHWSSILSKSPESWLRWFGLACLPKKRFRQRRCIHQKQITCRTVYTKKNPAALYTPKKTSPAVLYTSKKNRMRRSTLSFKIKIACGAVYTRKITPSALYTQKINCQRRSTHQKNGLRP